MKFGDSYKQTGCILLNTDIDPSIVADTILDIHLVVKCFRAALSIDRR